MSAIGKQPWGYTPRGCKKKRGDIKIKGKDDTKAGMEGMVVETSEVKKKGEKQSGSSAEAVSLTALRSCNYFPIDAGNKNKKRWQSQASNEHLKKKISP